MFARINEDNANEAVRDFHDLHPYPPPVEDLNGCHRQWIADIISLVAVERGWKADALPGRARLVFEPLWWYDLVGRFISPSRCGATEGANP